jgi:hypothetical protein
MITTHKFILDLSVDEDRLGPLQTRTQQADELLEALANPHNDLPFWVQSVDGVDPCL